MFKKGEKSEAPTAFARPTGEKVDLRAFHAEIERRYPKILAKLAE